MQKSDKINIFVTYHNMQKIFENEVFTPLFTGSASRMCNKDQCGDNSGDNISDKNKYYAELTGHYWVWKNYLPQNKDLEYIGFCHYRRFIDFFHKPEKGPFVKFNIDKFSKIFSKQYSEDKIYAEIKDYDVVLPAEWKMKESVMEQYVNAEHPKEVMDKTIEIVKRDYPDYTKFLDEALNSKQGYFCLTYVMKSYLFDEWMSFVMDILFKLENELDFSAYLNTTNSRIAGFVAERLFNVWIQYKIEAENIKVLEKHSYFLMKIIKFFGGQYTENDKESVLKIFGIKFRHSKLSKEKSGVK